MAMPGQGEWRSLCVSPRELRLDVSLVNGQSFTWRPVAEKEWMNALDDSLISLRQTEDDVWFKVHMGKSDEAVAATLRDYFQLDTSLHSLYSHWAAADPNMAAVATLLPGIRLLRQNPTENLFAFICSSNNHITRISKMVNTLKTRYGAQLCVEDGSAWHTFPRVSALAADGVEEELRQCGFGYRAKFIAQTAKQLVATHGDGADEWLHSLRSAPYEEAHKSLLQLPGVGPKVADCVCLMSLDKTGAVPVDTHVWSIAQPYMPHLQSKTLTARTYAEIGNFYRALHGPYAGWAHSVLFSAELKRFETRVLALPRTQEKKTTPRKKKSVVKRGAAETDAGTPVKQEPATQPAKAKGSRVKVEIAPMPAGGRSRKRVKVETEAMANSTQLAHSIDDTVAGACNPAA